MLTPRQFGTKVAFNFSDVVNSPYAAPVAGAALGGIGGALMGGKKNRFRNALLGAAGGGALGAGYNQLLSRASGAQGGTPQQNANVRKYNLEADGRPFASRAADPSGLPVAQPSTDTTDYSKTYVQRMYENLLGNPRAKKSASAASTEKQADMQALVNKLMPYLQQAKTMGGDFIKSDIGRHALGGGAIGAGLGGLAGLVNPGEDEAGNRRSRFGAMLRGALGGGALGAGAGGALGYAAPKFIPGLLDSPRGRDAREALGLPTDRLKLTPRQDVTMGGDIGKAPAPVTNANRPNYSTFRMDSSNPKRQQANVTAPSDTNPTIGRANSLIQAGRDLGATTGASVAPAQGVTTSKTVPDFNASAMKAPGSSTYTPTDTGAVAKMRAIEKAKADAKHENLVGRLQGTSGKAKLDAQLGAQNRQQQLDTGTGVANASPALLQMKQQDPEGFARMLQQARDKQVEENLRTAPNKGFDATDIDMSTMTPPVSATLGR